MNDLTTYAAMDLPDLLDAIHMEHDRAIRSAKTTIDHATRCGNMLLAAKEKVQHGEWEKWVDANTTLSSRNAQRYMRIASKASSMTLLEGGMGIAEALEMISTPTTLKVDPSGKPKISRDAASVTIEAEVVEPMLEKESARPSELEESIENVVNPPDKKIIIREDNGMAIWASAKCQLDRISKTDSQRIEALNACVAYCQKRLASKK
jgi:hypothetical protein